MNQKSKINFFIFLFFNLNKNSKVMEKQIILLKNGKCSNCKGWNYIVYKDYVPRKLYVQLCLKCCLEYFPEQKEKLIESLKDRIKECVCCDKLYLPYPEDTKKKKCSECFSNERPRIFDSNLINFKIVSKEKRKKHIVQDYSKLQEKRKKWCSQLLILQIKPMIEVLEMYEDENCDAVKSEMVIPQYFHEYKFCNTRTKLLNETRFEVDTLPWSEALEVCFNVCKRLKVHGFNYNVFCSNGNRSPHIILFGFDELAEITNTQHRYEIQFKFWKRIAGKDFVHADKNIWFDDNLFVPLEYSVHWKTGQPFEEVVL